MTRSAEHTAARRAVARKHHPDLGGDPEVYAAELAAVERRYNRLTEAQAPTTAFRRESAAKRRARAMFRAITRTRNTRYFDI
nr:hypothetical protein [Rhodococcus sp. (in: high G+C Gram-positive bacteria)]